VRDFIGKRLSPSAYTHLIPKNVSLLLFLLPPTVAHRCPPFVTRLFPSCYSGQRNPAYALVLTSRISLRVMRLSTQTSIRSIPAV
jgi:hypothetical protein